MVRKRFLSSSSGAWSISSGVKRVLSWGRGGVRLECETGGEGLRSLSIRLLFLLFCCTSSSRRLTVVRPTTRRKSSFWGGEGERSGVMLCATVRVGGPDGRERGTYLSGVIQFKRGLLCYSPEMSSHLLFVTLIV